MDACASLQKHAHHRHHDGYRNDWRGIPVGFMVFIVVQQIENHLLIPNAIASRVRLEPLLVTVCTAIGFVLFGRAAKGLLVMALNLVDDGLEFSLTDSWSAAEKGA